MSLVASDLDGTVRQPLRIFDEGRDNSRFGIVRVVYGLLATIFAKRINKHIDADFYITGSPAYENFTTRIWLLLHGMKPRVYANKAFSRFRDRDRVVGDKQIGSALHKSRMIYLLDVDLFFENDHRQVEILQATMKERTKIHEV